MMMKTLIAVAVATMAVLSCVGCRSDSSQQAKPGPTVWPEELRDLSVVWTAEKDVDLLTGPAVPVRAYIESFLLGDLTGKDENLYPGFVNAAAEPWRPSGPPARQPWVGTVTNHILSITQSGTEVTALACMYTYNAATRDPTRQPGDDYGAHGIPFGAPEAGITAFKVTLAAPPTTADHPRAQDGASRVALDDVFGGYEITGFHGGYFGAKGADLLWPERYEAAAECIAKAPDPFERRSYLTTNFLPRSEFPTLPATPGWPAKPES